jgi:hypothetical protein
VSPGSLLAFEPVTGRSLANPERRSSNGEPPPDAVAETTDRSRGGERTGSHG